MAAINIVTRNEPTPLHVKLICDDDTINRSTENVRSKSKRVAPEAFKNAPSSAWGVKECHRPNQKQNFVESRRESIDELLEEASQQRCETTCNYIELPTSDDDNMRLCTKHERLKPSSAVFVPILSDESISLKIIKRVRKKKRKKSSSFDHFLCPPYFILAASVLEIFVYVLADGDLDKQLIYSPQHRYQAWRFISYMLLHNGVVHLTLNVIIQTLLATPLELEQGWWRCAIVYLGGGLMGALGASVFQPTLHMVGSSAGVYALLIAHLANVILRYKTIKYKWYRIVSVGVLACSDMAFSIAHTQVGFENLPKIGWAAHGAGAIAGISIGMIIFKGDEKSNPLIRLSVGISIFLIVSSVIGAVFYNVFVVIT